MSRITDADFEALCRDLFGEILGVTFEIFARGKDQGVDLRYITPSNETWIVQCKHWDQTKRSNLVNYMKRHERPKVDLLSPDRYILATSVDLNPKAKSDLFDALSPHIGTTGDIWGAREIEAELRQREHIVRRHIRLWLNSTAVLNAMLTNSIVTRSRMLLEDTKTTLLTYVPNLSLSRAAEILDSEHVCVIAGAPGVGKTTLAQVIAAAHVGDGYELIEISEDVEEAFAAWRDGDAQIFYYDDFLGATALDDKLRKNEDIRLTSLMRQIKKDPTKRLVLTSREYILAQAEQRYEVLAREDFNLLTCVLDLTDYQLETRAQLLYNHVYFAPVSDLAKAAFADPLIHLPLLNHPNFNPRLISIALTLAAGRMAAEDVPTQVLNTLNRPEQLWRHIVENQLNAAQVAVIEALFSLPTANRESLRIAWRALQSYRGIQQRDDELRRALQILDGTLIRIDDSPFGARISFANPSIRDFMVEYLTERPDSLLELLQSISYHEQVEVLWASVPCLRDAGAVPGEVRTVLEESLPGYWLSRPLNGTLTEAYPRRLLASIEIAEAISSEELSAQIAHALKYEVYDLVHETADLDVVVAIAERVRHSGHELLSDLEVDFAGAITERIMGSLVDWDAARQARRIAESLDLDLDANDVDRIDRAIKEGAIQLVERWHAGDSSLALRDDLTEVLEIADVQYEESPADRDDFPSWLNPAQAMQNFIHLAGEHSVYWNRDVGPERSDADANRAVARIFAGLAAFATTEEQDEEPKEPRG